MPSTHHIAIRRAHDPLPAGIRNRGKRPRLHPSALALMSRHRRQLPPRANLAAWFDAARSITADTAGAISQWADRSGLAGRDLLQPVGSAQPMLSRPDRLGNALPWAIDFAPPRWALAGINAFGSSDTGAPGAGSFSRTMRTLDPLPPNTRTSSFLQEDVTLGQHQVAFAAAYLPPSQPLRLRVFARAAGRASVCLRVADTADSQSHIAAIFRLDNGTCAATSFNGSASAPSAAIRSQGGGWYECILQGTPSTTGTLCDAAIQLASGTSLSYQGDNASGVFLWGASLQGAGWPEDPVITAGSPQYPGRAGFRSVWFNGQTHYLRTAPFPLTQPVSIYMAAQWVSWSMLDWITDGNTPDSTYCLQTVQPPQTWICAGSWGVPSVPTAIGQWHVLTMQFNGAASLLQLNRALPQIGNAGNANPGGFTLGARAGGAWPANIQVGEVLLYAAVHGSSDRARVQQYLARKWEVAL